MKKGLILAALAMAGSLAYGSTATTQDLDVTLETQVKMGVKAWWDLGNEKHDVDTTSRVFSIPAMSPGQRIENIPSQYIRLVGPLSNNQNNIEVKLKSGNLELEHEADSNYKVDIPVRLKDYSINNAPYATSINVSTDNNVAQDILSTKYYAESIGSSFDDIKSYVGGEKIEVAFNPENVFRRIPVKPGHYSGTSEIVVSLID